MKLLIITQKVDLEDSNLSFFHRWIEKFSEKLDKVYVICLSQGRYNLPPNVRVFSLGKGKGISKIGQFLRLQKNLIQILPKVDGVFVHMCPIYVLASFPLVKILRKKIILWYAHVKASFLVKIVEKLVSRILTISKDSFVYQSSKVKVMGHGIDTNLFRPAHPVDGLTHSGAEPPRARGSISGDKKVILSTGRIAPVKDLETLILALDILVNQKGIGNVKVKIVGSPIDNYEREYSEKLKKLISNKKLEDYIEFLAGVPNKDLVKFYQESDVFVNTQAGGGAGKAILEAMACGLPVVLCTRALNEWLGSFSKEVIFEEKNSSALAQNLLNCLNFSEAKRKNFANLLRDIVVKNHNLDNLIDKIILEF